MLRKGGQFRSVFIYYFNLLYIPYIFIIQRRIVIVKVNIQKWYTLFAIIQKGNRDTTCLHGAVGIWPGVLFGLCKKKTSTGW